MRVSHFFRSGYWRGHHVHSPYVFHVVRNVITTRGRNKSVLDMQKAFRKSLTKRCGHSPKGLMSYKYSMMLTRLVHELQPESYIVAGDSCGFHSYCISLGVSNARILTLSDKDANASDAVAQFMAVRTEGAGQAGAPYKPVLLFIGSEVEHEDAKRILEAYLSKALPLSVIVLDKVFHSAQRTDIWRSLVEDQRISTTIELAQMGLAYVRTGCQKEHYCLRW